MNKYFTQIKRNAISRFKLTYFKDLKASYLTFVFISIAGLTYAQPAYYNGASGTNYSASPLSSTTLNKAQWVYGPGVFKTNGSTGTAAPGGVIEKIYFRLGTTVSSSAAYADFTVSLGQKRGTATTWSSASLDTGITTVFYASSYTLSGATASSWYAITLNKPFPYDPSLSLVFELKVSKGTGNTVAQTTAGGNQRIYALYSNTSGTIGTGLVDFGINVKTSANDLSTIGIVGLNNNCGSKTDPLFVQIKNMGIIDIAASQNIPVNSVVTGVTGASFSRSFNRALKVGATDTIHVGYLRTDTAKGSINIKSWVTMAKDTVPGNDTNLTKKSFLGIVKPILDFTTTIYCDSIKFTNQTKDACNIATKYLWDFDNGKTSSKYSVSHTFNSPGTYNVKLMVFYGPGLKDSIIKKVTVYSLPQANFSFTNQCLGTAIDFSNFSYGVNSYRWAFGDGGVSTLTNPTRNYAFAGSYNVKLVATTPSGCKDSVTKVVTIYPKPVPSFSAKNSCQGSDISITNASFGVSSYDWDFGDGTSSVQANPSKSYSNPVNQTITLTVTSSKGCTDFASLTINIYPLPVSSFTAKDNCIGSSSTFTSTSTGASKYAWTFGDGGVSSSQSTIRTYGKVGSYDVSLTAISVNGCTNISTKTININAKPQAFFGATSTCIGNSVPFSNLSTFPSGTGTYLWRFGDGNTSNAKDPSYLYGAPGNYDVSLVAITPAGCRDSINDLIKIFSKPQASFTANQVCDGQKVEFINTSSGGTIQNWDFGDGSGDNSFSPSHVYAGPNTYKVKLQITSGDNCKDEFEANAIVNPKADLLFFGEDHCHGTKTTFTNSSSGVSFYSWTFGDGDSTTTVQPSHTYANSGTYSVKLRGMTSKGCVTTLTKSIKVFAKPQPAFNAATVCHGVNTQFTNSSTGAVKYLWNFGDGNSSSTLSDPAYLYTNPGNYKVLLTAISSNNCEEFLTKSITVDALPVPNFIVQDVCVDIQISPANFSTGSISGQTWNFGDGKTDTTRLPKHIYTTPGIYTVKLTVKSGLGCIDSTSKTILVFTKPTIKISDDVGISKGFSTNLLAGGGTDYLWTPATTLNDASIANPIATPDQNTRYIVNVTNSFGCVDTASVFVSLLEDFNLVPQNLITPNANGENDTWKIQGIEFYPDAKVMLFDQWGRILLDETNYKNTWDGTLDGKALPDGTYFYVISLTGTERVYKGLLTILKN
jgi:gliding motility-associated-like protein